MGRKAKVEKAPFNITEQQLELGSRVLTACGVGLLAYGFAKSIEIGANQLPTALPISTTTTVVENVKNTLAKRVKKSISNVWQAAKAPWDRFKIARDSWEKSTEGITKNVAEKAMNEAAAIVEPYLTTIQYLSYGLAMVTAGLSYYLLSHPDVLKVAIQEVAHISRQIVDEISEAGDALASIIDQLMPSLLDLIGVPA